MRQLRDLWLNKYLNCIEVRFDDGGCSIPIAGKSSEKLIYALEYLAETIKHLEHDSPYPVPNAEITGRTLAQNEADGA